MAETKKYEILGHAHEVDIDPEHYQIFLFGRENVDEEMELGEPGVEYKMANRFIKNILYLSGMDSKRPILIHMKSCGGHVQEGMAIYDTILATPNPVTIINYTHARSMTSIIFQAANKRIMMPNSMFMYHMGDTSIAGTEKTVRSYVDFFRQFDDTMLTIYAERMKYSATKYKGWTIAKIKDHLQHEMDRKEEVYLTAKETVEEGFADEIFTDYQSVFNFTKQQKGFK